MAMEELYGEASQNARKFDACMNVLAIRIATVFASLKVNSCNLHILSSLLD
jgi:syntaxin-binding protein 1